MSTEIPLLDEIELLALRILSIDLEGDDDE
jgi:hypothetical protein